ncbi:MAG: hypothetical protein M1383_00755 [Patescibacteria group bacterium]|nr:hypothetical protein [Patescibacteria group bacterium]
MALVPVASAEEVENWLVARLAMRNAATQHYSQFYQQRGRLIGPDVIYVDFGKNNYRETFIGGGGVLYKANRFSLTHEDYFGQASGPAAKGASYILPWTKVDYKVNSRISGNAVYFFYIPLNSSAGFHQSIERAKLEYDFKHFKLGAGYAGSQSIGKDWQNKPLLTTTVKAGKFGSVEFWLQRLPGNHAQLQVRYSVLLFKTGKPEP